MLQWTTIFISRLTRLHGVERVQVCQKVARLVTDKLTTKQLCVEDVCVGKEQLKFLLERNAVVVKSVEVRLLQINRDHRTITVRHV